MVLSEIDMEEYRSSMYQAMLDGTKVRVGSVWVTHRKFLPSLTKVRAPISPHSRCAVADKHPQAFCEEAISWTRKRLEHPNLAPLLGFTVDPLRFVTEWMPNGDLPEYIEKNPDVDRVRLVSFSFRCSVYFILTTATRYPTLRRALPTSTPAI